MHGRVHIRARNPNPNDIDSKKLRSRCPLTQFAAFHGAVPPGIGGVDRRFGSDLSFRNSVIPRDRAWRRARNRTNANQFQGRETKIERIPPRRFLDYRAVERVVSKARSAKCFCLEIHHVAQVQRRGWEQPGTNKRQTVRVNYCAVSRTKCVCVCLLHFTTALYVEGRDILLSFSSTNAFQFLPTLLT